MPWIRKASSEFRTSQGPNLTDEEVRAIYCTPSTCSSIACRRLRYLSSFGKASPFLLALLQGCPRTHPWVTQTQVLPAELQAASPKIASMPSPWAEEDTRVQFAISHSNAWKGHLAAWADPHMWQAEERPKEPCPECGKLCHPQGMGAHQAKEHGKIRVARLYFDASGICPACLSNFGSRLRCMHHIHYGSAACLTELEAGGFVPLQEDLRAQLDRLDALER